MLWLGPALACGSFAPRPTPAPTPLAQPGLDVTNPSGAADADTSGTDETLGQSAVNTPLPELPTSTPEPGATPTFTATPAPGTELVAGRPARVVAPNGLNMRSQATAGSQLIIQLGTNQRVDVLAGPTEDGGFTWWQVDDGQGNAGWVADGDSETEWLSPAVGSSQPVNRPPRVNDRVVVTIETELSLRGLPGTDGPLITRVNPGTELTVIAGPQSANGFQWYQLRNDAGTLEGWAADGDDESRWLSPIE